LVTGHRSSVTGYWSLVIDSGFFISLHSCIHALDFGLLRIHAFTHYSIHALAVGMFYSFAPSVTTYGLSRKALFKVFNRKLFLAKRCKDKYNKGMGFGLAIKINVISLFNS
jgi:hypothetical protein